MKALKDILVSCFVCKASVKYTDAYRKLDEKGDTMTVSYICYECEEKENAEKK